VAEQLEADRAVEAAPREQGADADGLVQRGVVAAEDLDRRVAHCGTPARPLLQRFAICGVTEEPTRTTPRATGPRDAAVLAVMRSIRDSTSASISTGHDGRLRMDAFDRPAHRSLTCSGAQTVKGGVPWLATAIGSHVLCIIATAKAQGAQHRPWEAADRYRAPPPGRVR
jgi:hypothetical protein